MEIENKVTTERQTTEENIGQPIPTIVSTGTERMKTKERIPNPFARKEVSEWEDQPLKPPLSPPTQPTNDLEGVMEEMKKIYSQEEQNKTTSSEHSTTCGCETCFWKEKQKIGKLTEKNVGELIENFIQQRTPIKTTKEKHNPKCMCVTCIREKVEISKETIIKDLLTKSKEFNKDPRLNKDLNKSK